MDITAKMILEALAVKHSGDVFVSECKTGSSWVSRYQSLDAWVMPKSWSHMNILGYEIKVNRQDFLNDNKWQNYMDYCHSMYFVCPPKLIQPEELPENVGLLWTSANCTKLYTKRKAVKRDVDISNDIFMYVLMWRAVICGEKTHQSSYEYYKQWLKEKQDKKELGITVSKRIHDRYYEDVQEVNKANEHLREQIKEYQEIEKMLVDLGLDISCMYGLKRGFREKVQELQQGFDKDFLWTVGRLTTALEDFQRKYKEHVD